MTATKAAARSMTLVLIVISLLTACGGQSGAPLSTATSTAAREIADASATTAPAPSVTPLPSATTAPPPSVTPLPSATTAPSATPPPSATATARPTQTALPPTATPVLATPAPDPLAIDIQLFQFRPDPVSVPAGTTITWTNRDDIQHTVTSGTAPDPDGDFDSDFFTLGQSYTRRFDQAGTFTYFCRRHPSMQGAITVVTP